jgi:hypothetical protein
VNPEWLIVAPCFDDVSADTLEEAKDVINYLEEKEVEYICLLDSEAVLSKVAPILNQYPKCNFGHWNHGSADCVWGDDEKPIISLSNVEFLSNRDCYNSNCSSAKKLGVEAWKLGATYWGYTDLVSYTKNALKEFMEAFNYGIKRHIDGFSWKECLEKTKQRMTELADALIDAGKVLAGACMREDRDILVCYGVDVPETPEPWCKVRKVATALFGKTGWFISRKLVLGTASTWAGLSLMVHDFFEACEVIDNPYTVQGFWFGLLFAVSGFFLITSDIVEWIRKQKK